MTLADLRALSRDHSRPVETRRAALAAIDALAAVDVRLRIDAGAPTGDVPDGEAMRRTWRAT